MASTDSGRAGFRLMSALFCALILTAANAAFAATFTAGVGCNGPFNEVVGPGAVNNSCTNPNLPLGGITPLGTATQIGDASSSVRPFAMHLGSTAILNVPAAPPGLLPSPTRPGESGSSTISS